MSRRYYSSIAVPTTLSSGVTDSGTTFALAASTGFPSSYPFTLIVDEDTAYEEVVTVTASLGGNSFTVTRGSDGTTALSVTWTNRMSTSILQLLCMVWLGRLWVRLTPRC